MAMRETGRGGMRAVMTEGAMPRPGRRLPAWRQALVVVAHPDDETFGLGAIADRFTVGGTAVHVLCFTHGEASTLNENHAELRGARARELRQAAAELGVVTVTLLDYPDGHLATVPRESCPAMSPAWLRAMAQTACWFSMTPASPATLTTKPQHAQPCTRRGLALCRCWPGPAGHRR